MSLSTAIRSLLNKFADTQIALRLADKPLESSNPQLGDAIGSALDAAATSPGTSYTPAATLNWTGADPTTVQEALDRIAAAIGPIA